MAPMENDICVAHSGLLLVFFWPEAGAQLPRELGKSLSQATCNNLCHTKLGWTILNKLIQIKQLGLDEVIQCNALTIVSGTQLTLRE